MFVGQLYVLCMLTTVDMILVLVNELSIKNKVHQFGTCFYHA